MSRKVMNTPLFVASGCSPAQDYFAVPSQCTGRCGVAWYIAPFASGFTLMSCRAPDSHCAYSSRSTARAVSL